MSERRPFGDILSGRVLGRDEDFDPYKEFAFEVCIKAIEDYAHFVKRPDLSEEVEEAKKYLEDAQKIGEIYKNNSLPLKELKKTMYACLKRQLEKRKKTYHDSFKVCDDTYIKHRAIVRNAKTIQDLGEAVRIIQSVGNLIYENAIRRSNKRISEKMMCKRFIESEQFYLFSGLENGKEITRHIEETYGGNDEAREHDS